MFSITPFAVRQLAGAIKLLSIAPLLWVSPGSVKANTKAPKTSFHKGME
jgi:hypothetical protein